MKNKIPFWIFVKHYRKAQAILYTSVMLLMLVASIRSNWYVSGLIVTACVATLYWTTLYFYEWKQFRRIVGRQSLDEIDKKYALEN